MNPKTKKIIVYISAAVFVTAMILLFLSISGVPLANVRIFFRPEPEMPTRYLGEEKATADREAVVMTSGCDTLDGDLKDVYDTIGEYANKSYAERFYVQCGHSDFSRVHRAYMADHPEIFWISKDNTEYHYWDYGDSIEVEYDFAYEGDSLDEMKQELSDRVEKIMSEAPEKASDYGLELYFNDYLSNHVDYDKEKEGSMIRNSYGALIIGRAVCAGYSEGFQLLCNRAGIECESVYGYITQTDGDNNVTEENNLHQWNCVKIDGDWYYTDVTWNDNGASSDMLAHAYFNITYDEISKTRSFNPLYEDDPDWDRDTLFNVLSPKCEATEYNYYNKSCTVISDLKDDDEIIASIMKAAKEKKPCIDFRISGELDFDSIKDDIADNYVVYWTDAANFYNKDDPSIIHPKEMYYYGKTHCIVFDLNYK